MTQPTQTFNMITLPSYKQLPHHLRVVQSKLYYANIGSLISQFGKVDANSCALDFLKFLDLRHNS